MWFTHHRQQPSQVRSLSTDTPVSPQPLRQATDQLDARTPQRSTVRTPKRVKVRYAFQFYQDQILKLKQLRRRAVLKDEDFSMSDVVRLALDKYLEGFAE